MKSWLANQKLAFHLLASAILIDQSQVVYCFLTQEFCKRFNIIAYPLYLVRLILLNLVSSLNPFQLAILFMGHELAYGWGIWVVQNQNAPFRKKSDSI